MKAINIKWDAIKSIQETLPSEIEIPDTIDKYDEDAISDYISEQTGWCHYGFQLDPEP